MSAMVEVYLNNNQVHYHKFNILNGDYRDSFVNKVYKHPLIKETEFPVFYSAESMKVDFHTFCYQAPEASFSSIDATVLTGDSMLEVGSYIENLVVKGGVTIINGQPKKGKSFIAMAMAVSVDAGCSEIWNVEQANSLYINLERSERSMVKRLGGINTALGLDPARSLPFLNVRGQTLSSIQNNVKKIIKDRDIKFIVLDSISRAGEGSLVEDRTGLAVTDALNNLIEETDKSWLAIAHRGWSDEHIFGSIHFLGACDVMVATNSAYNDNKDLGVKLISEGQNDVPPMESPVIKLEFDDWGLRAMSKTSEEEFPDLISDTRFIKDKIIEYLTQNGSQTDVQIAIDINEKKDSVNKSLRRHPEVFRPRGKRPIFWNVSK